MRAISLVARAQIVALLLPAAATAQSTSFGAAPTVHETPLLPMIFFEQGSDAIPDRYQQLDGPAESGHYDETSAIDEEDGDIAKYYQILDIVGFRLLRYPAATITLRGEYADESGESEALARDRAGAVKEYIERVWRIAPERIALQAPLKGSRSSDLRATHEEARRVVIASETPGVLCPVRFFVNTDDRAVFTSLDEKPAWQSPRLAA